MWFSAPFGVFLRTIENGRRDWDVVLVLYVTFRQDEKKMVDDADEMGIERNGTSPRILSQFVLNLFFSSFIFFSHFFRFFVSNSIHNRSKTFWKASYVFVAR